MIVYNILGGKKYVDLDNLYKWISCEGKHFAQRRVTFRRNNMAIITDVSTKRFFSKIFITPENARVISYKSYGKKAMAVFLALTQDLNR